MKKDKPSKSKESILVVDDEQIILKMVQSMLTSYDYNVLTAASVAEALNILESNQINLVITDIVMPIANGFDLIKHTKQNYKDTSVMVMTGAGSIDGAVQAVKEGAEEYLVKPFTIKTLLPPIVKILKDQKTRQSGNQLDFDSSKISKTLIGESEAMQTIFNTIAKAARSNATVLISGESGTGKEPVARSIHANSQVGSAPFVPVNCSAIPQELLESELFGHVKGSFTGAIANKAGFFQTANGGTIFLDEIGETSPLTQVKLLRVIQDKEFNMVGSTDIYKVNIRILTATNKNLEQLVRNSLFREDLFYRLNVISIEMPPLRDRGDDIIILVKHFMRKFAAEYQRPPVEFSDNTLKALKDYHWPGNVRELENLMQRLIVMTDSNIIEICDLPPHMRFSAYRGDNYNRTLDEVESDYITHVLMNVAGNKSKAAKILGIDRKTLHAKILKYKLEEDPPT